MPAWSYSVLSLYETCPKKFYHYKVLKDVKDVKGEAATYGDEVHKKIEQFMRGKGGLPIDLKHHEEHLMKLRGLGGEKMVELKLAVNDRLAPTDWFSNDVFCRAIIDYGVVGDTFAYICDWKTGKMKDDMTQLRLMAAMLFSFKPELQAVRAEYYWLQRKKPAGITMKKDEVADTWAELIKRAKPVFKIGKADEYAPKPSGLCKKYCAVGSCPYHGV